MAKHTVTLIPGDGIGPEITTAMRRVVDATGVDIDWEIADAGEHVMGEYGTPLPDHVIESVRKNKVAIKGPVTTPDRDRLSQRQRGTAQGVRLVHEPEACSLDPRHGRSLRGRRYRDRPREHRGPLRRHRV